MAKLPVLKPHEVVSRLEAVGFVEVRQRGAHKQFRHPDFVHQVADFLKSIEEGKPCEPTFRTALETAKICDAVLASGADRTWHNVE